MIPHALVIEDSPDMAEGLERLLGKNGWYCEVAGTVAAGIARASTEPYPQVILLDLCLPDSGPWETVNAIRKLLRNGPVVVLSSYEGNSSEGVSIEEAVSAQGGYYVPKLFTPEGEKQIFDGMLHAMRAWKLARIPGKKDTSSFNNDLLEMRMLGSAIDTANGHAC